MEKGGGACIYLVLRVLGMKQERVGETDCAGAGGGGGDLVDTAMCHHSHRRS